jgi:peptidyl-dipeptidase Dcp
MRRLFAVSLAVSILSGSVVVLLSQSTAAPPTSAAPVNAVAAPWTGPFGGVPPWDVVFVPGCFPRPSSRRSPRNAPSSRIAPTPIRRPSRTRWRRCSAPADARPRQRLFSVMTSNMNSPEYQALEREWQPRFAAASDEILFDPALFARVEPSTRPARAPGCRTTSGGSSSWCTTRS